METKCPTVLSIAIILLILASLLSWLIVFLPGESNDPGSLVVLYGSVVLGVLGLVAAFGIFNLKRWGMWLAIGVSVFSALFGVGGIANSSSPLTKGLCIVSLPCMPWLSCLWSFLPRVLPMWQSGFTRCSNRREGELREKSIKEANASSTRDIAI